ncbi:DUF4296 domain-containing protein [Apibacter sp.]|uniref:DUF4296 domain-containing protein n=1 Tax=Apibacter sp. TaxID=2023709 RepID=UPI0025E9551A|nr:DUF4296 domain-containing protein [Apibacter sp.]MCT6868574.1 DUF4296 domain-containing protein [Apibacter sp.]
MKLYFYIFFFLFLSLFSCQHALKKPDKLLSKTDMIAILSDIYLYNQTPSNIPLSKEIAFETYVSIFKAHHTTKEIFQDSYVYYYADANALQHIYDGVINHLKNKLSKEQQNQLKMEELSETN